MHACMLVCMLALHEKERYGKAAKGNAVEENKKMGKLSVVMTIYSKLSQTIDDNLLR